MSRPGVGYTGSISYTSTAKVLFQGWTIVPYCGVLVGDTLAPLGLFLLSGDGRAASDRNNGVFDPP